MTDDHVAIWSPRRKIEVCFYCDKEWPCPIGKETAMDEETNYMASAVTNSAPSLKVGHVVVFLAGDDHVHNGTRSHPAIVTRVWGDGARPTVNLKVFPDCGEPFDATSVQHWTNGYINTSDDSRAQLSYVYREV